MIYVPDQKELFARICSFFEHISYDIYEAKIYTTRHGYALDSFQVSSVTLPDELQAAMDRRISMDMTGDMGRFTQYQAAESLPLAPLQAAARRLRRDVQVQGLVNSGGSLQIGSGGTSGTLGTGAVALLCLVFVLPTAVTLQGLVQRGMAVEEGAAAGILPDQTHRITFVQQRGIGKVFRHAPIERQLALGHQLAVGHDLVDARMQFEVLGHFGYLAAEHLRGKVEAEAFLPGRANRSR